MPVRLATQLLDISQLHTRSSINDQNKISLCTTRILPHFSSDYEQSLDRFPRLYRPWFLLNSSCVCPASFFPCRVTYRLMISSVIPTVDTKYPLTTSEITPCYGHSLDVNHPDRSFRSASPVATGIQDDLYIRSFFRKSLTDMPLSTPLSDFRDTALRSSNTLSSLSCFWEDINWT